jgi:branched-chain amino acid transport system substrate-binding protein
MRTICKVARYIILFALLAITITACGSSGGTNGSQTIVIGATLPLTGSLASVGTILKAGYQAAVDDVNAAGGLDVQGAKVKVKFIALDNQSDPNTASDQANTLYLQDNAVGLLGPFTPPLTIPVSNVAERLKHPLISTATPIQAWLSGRPSGWDYSWDVFFNESQQTQLPYLTANEVQTNKRVAIFNDTEQDGIVQGALWQQNARQLGYDVVYHAKFPVGTTNFSSQINAAEAANAQILVAQMIPPDAVALFKQIKALGYHPKLVQVDKGAATVTWPQALGPLAEGSLTSNFWSPSLGYPDTSNILAKAAKLGYTDDSQFAGVAASYSIARVLMDAIEQAHSTDANAVNAAIAKTNKTYPLGHIQFAQNHASTISAIMMQWQNGKQVQVYPTVQGNKMEFPLPGLS